MNKQVEQEGSDTSTHGRNRSYDTGQWCVCACACVSVCVRASVAECAENDTTTTIVQPCKSRYLQQCHKLDVAVLELRQRVPSHLQFIGQRVFGGQQRGALPGDFIHLGGQPGRGNQRQRDTGQRQRTIKGIRNRNIATAFTATNHWHRGQLSKQDERTHYAHTTRGTRRRHGSLGGSQQLLRPYLARASEKRCSSDCRSASMALR